jgi:hypothetical protein
MDEIHWLPLSTRCPYVRKIIKQEKEKLVYNGYFYLEDNTMPVKRIMCQNSNLTLVEITKKITLDDTSVYGEYDKELGGRACFFPTNVIELEFKIIKEIKDMKELDSLQKEIESLEIEITERNEQHRRVREEAEFIKMSEEWKKLDYKTFFETMRDDVDLDNI